MAEKERRKKKRGKRKRRAQLLIHLEIFVLVGLLVVAAWLAFQRARACITISAVDVEMDEGTEIPALSATVSVSGYDGMIWDYKDRETAADLAAAFEKGEGFTVSCEGDTDYEGEYPLTVTLDASVEADLNRGLNPYLHLVTVEVKEGTLTSKNPLGYWEGEKFKTYDGTYVTEDFVPSNTKIYYFDADGNRVTGLQVIDGFTYDFGDDGAMAVDTWETVDDATYYFDADGKAKTGWVDLEGSTYYFLADGVMATGHCLVDEYHCVFSDDGKLESKEKAPYDPDKPMVALTFDDGPGDRTMELLEKLQACDARATFFMLGQRVDSHQDELKKMVEIGCELGNHTYDHKQLTGLSSAEIKKEVEDTNKKIKAITGQNPTLVRPPYGAVNSTVRAAVKAPLIVWNVDSLDWQTRDTQKDIDAVMDTLEDGNIILMHDIHTETIDAALELIPMIQKEGYQLVTVSEMAEAKGIKLENGEKYFNF